MNTWEEETKGRLELAAQAEREGKCIRHIGMRFCVGTPDWWRQTWGMGAYCDVPSGFALCTVQEAREVIGRKLQDLALTKAVCTDLLGQIDSYEEASRKKG